jgi:hypothetical protein
MTYESKSAVEETEEEEVEEGVRFALHALPLCVASL